ncbi:RNA-binding protein, putative [Trypanosoma brucei gambiense DAL972]|uniref:RNA-binding protein, putative n=2 Tax=Trypanosoma brucei TaxID=5691 RepID=C9ZM55_TRYB9|nr:RNA-binding protein, putative [Trypanosoma brucei gambiense DAL972]RHW73038.1 RNA-binding protein [Trypanosoma brucei equiperdum]CBH10480.1 RNA-binding protein, putative [Trypanosoma brucei gambiense DAL972]|eukprot:XP_011772770.1 RNA-binding protein, putative [Trypanosoma brucei gambiense DAL972]
MATWADDMEPIALGEDFGGNQLTPQEAKALADKEAAWKNAKVVTETITDAENKQYEIVKRVLQYRVDREATPVDVRAKWKRFGRATNPADQKDLVSRDPPIVLELGEVDPFERMAREEVMRLMNEVERYTVEVKDVHLARYAKVKEEQERAAKEAAAPDDQGKERTWAAARGDKTSVQHKEDTDRRLRITNISDDISREELYNIFNTDEYRIDKLFLPTDGKTSNYRGFAFITFETPEQAERCLSRTKGVARFKNTVMHIVRALPEGAKQRS